MDTITRETSIEELASILSRYLEKAGILATLSGGGAVSIYTHNDYQSYDLDFVTSASRKELRDALAPIGFQESSNLRQFEHPHTEWFVEFPPSPLGFGDLIIDHKDIPIFNTKHGPLRVITPTLSVIDRLAAYWYHYDPQCWDQAIKVCQNRIVDWQMIYDWAANEGQSKQSIDSLRAKSEG
ncbi:hypothetical protein [Saccharospirillum salsuginis]|uniref:Nucleotidyltransferase family protein n=1 Tax=Saccharospirillum salsuginis TaxID=418750 RepID=A0A918N7F6_9GAMM|nr:hypothetical protein [Saccharospirillum salsuginis]GGX43732.1 hypothetical protein GCM10007392_08100 [Saccharospirillum salsuginis]